MTAQDRALTKVSIMLHEGFSPRRVVDTRGQVIGYGWNLETGPAMTEPEAQAILEDHVDALESAWLKAWPSFASCGGPQQRALVEMSYQIGLGGVLLFAKMLRAIAVKDHETAAHEVLNSNLAKQTPLRARDYAATLRERE